MTLNIGFVLFDRLTQLDLTGPLQVLSRLEGAKCHLVARSLDPVKTDTVLEILPTTTFGECAQLDIICVPGGRGVAPAISDPEVIRFLRAQSEGASWVTSVCTGAFLLGAAGLLKGRRATTHWAYKELLPLVGASPGGARVICDENLITGGGVTAGIDFGLQVAAEVAGPGVAQAIQLALEYDPAPPFDSGNPKFAPGPVREALEPTFERAREEMRAALAR